MRCSTFRGTFCSLITLAIPRQDWTGSNPSRREGGGCGFTLSRSHSCCAVRLIYTQISPSHIWTTLYVQCNITFAQSFPHSACVVSVLSYWLKLHIFWKTLQLFVLCFVQIAGISWNFGQIISFSVTGNLSNLYIPLWIIRSYFYLLHLFNFSVLQYRIISLLQMTTLKNSVNVTYHINVLCGHAGLRMLNMAVYTGCFTTLGHNCRRWFPRSLWWKKFI